MLDFFHQTCPPSTRPAQSPRARPCVSEACPPAVSRGRTGTPSPGGRLHRIWVPEDSFLSLIRPHRHINSSLTKPPLAAGTAPCRHSPLQATARRRQPLPDLLHPGGDTAASSVHHRVLQLGPTFHLTSEQEPADCKDGRPDLSVVVVLCCVGLPCCVV